MYEIEFLPVGDSNGDAICIRHGDTESGFWLHLIDGGYTDTAAVIKNHIHTYYGQNYHINHMVLSHADNDHAAGLVGVMAHFHVENLWMNRPWLYANEIVRHMHGNYTVDGLAEEIRRRHPYLVELEDLATKKGTRIHDAFQGAQIGAFTVLAPSRRRYIELLPDLDKTPKSYAEAAPRYPGLLEKAATWLEEKWDIETLSNNPSPPTSASNESCVIQYASLDGDGVVLTADAGPSALTEAVTYLRHTLGVLTAPKFIQVPHHGSRHNVTPAVLDLWLGKRMSEGGTRGVAYCSVGANKPEYPRGQVKNAFARRGFPVFTQRKAVACYYSGFPVRPGWVTAIPEPFDTEVEA